MLACCSSLAPHSKIPDTWAPPNQCETPSKGAVSSQKLDCERPAERGGSIVSRGAMEDWPLASGRAARSLQRKMCWIQLPAKLPANRNERARTIGRRLRLITQL
jgi:hypothetical protein